MLVEDLEESNEAGEINERMEADNHSKQVEIVSAFEDSNVVSNRDSSLEPMQPKKK